MARDRSARSGEAQWQAAGNVHCVRQMQTLGMVAFLEQAQPMLEEVLTAVTTTQYSQCTVDCRLSSVVSQQHCGNPQCHSAQHALYSMHDTTMRGAAP